MESHVHGFGAFRLDVVVDNAEGRAVVGFEWCACFGLEVAHLLEGDNHRLPMDAACVNATGLSFGGGADDVLECLADDVDGVIDTLWVCFPTQVVVDGDSTACFGILVARCITLTLQCIRDIGYSPLGWR